MQVIHDRGYVYAIQYHIVWCTKYRRKVLTGPVACAFMDILKEYARENGFSIEESECMEDHIHLLIQASPQVYLPNIMKGMKGVSARKLFKQFPGIKNMLWGGHMWNPSYFAATVSEQTETQIRDYIRSQKER